MSPSVLNWWHNPIKKCVFRSDFLSDAAREFYDGRVLSRLVAESAGHHQRLDCAERAAMYSGGWTRQEMQEVSE